MPSNRGFGHPVEFRGIAPALRELKMNCTSSFNSASLAGAFQALGRSRMRRITALQLRRCSPSWRARRYRENKLKILDADGIRVDGIKSDILKQPRDFWEIDVAVPVPEMRGESLARHGRLGEVNDQDSPS